MAIIDLPRRHVAAKSHIPSEEELAAVAASIAPGKLLPFIRALKRERGAAAGDDERLVLMRMCADRAVSEDVPGNVDLALGELRWGR